MIGEGASNTNPEATPEIWPIVVIGAGAAGLTAAIFAARAGARVLLLETRPKPGAKIRVSGGGRCNVLPSQLELGDFHTSGSMHTLRNILYSWPLDEVHAFFETDLGVPLEQEPTGKVFPRSRRPLDVVEALLRAASRAGVTLRADERVVDLRRVEQGTARFELATAAGTTWRAERLVLATGGRSLPKTGSDGAGLRFAIALGMPHVREYPALVPLTTTDARWHALAGVATPARLRAVQNGTLLEERRRDFLITHRGFSGPVVLDLSRHVTGGTPPADIHVHWGQVADWDRLLRPAAGRRIRSVVAEHLPARLADLLLEIAGMAREQRESDLPRAERQALVSVLSRYPLPVTGDEGYATAEVTGGGIPLDAIHPRTLESRSIPQLYFCGEILDATGRIGGYNFLWAWVTGRKAGRAAAAG